MDNSAVILERFRRARSTDIDLTLRTPYFELLTTLGNPHKKLPPVIHVAGTNGKGSTCAFLRAMVEAAGYRAHVYTSPHLVSFHERIRIAGELIKEDELVAILQEIEQLAEPGSITYFEAATAAAFVAFTRHPADATILEVGLGGRLDATNIVPKPFATVIARLSFDHREYLGHTMTAIAHEKAGILRPNTPCFTAPQPSYEALTALQNAAAKKQAPLLIGGKDWRVDQIGDQEFLFESSKRSLTMPLPALTGHHQLWNAGLAIATLAAAPFEISDPAIRDAMPRVEWPARLQRLQHGTLFSLLPTGWELWLDGGHNDSAGEVLAQQIELWRHEDEPHPRPLHIILGMLNTKVPHEFLTPMKPYIYRMRTVSIDNEPLSRTADELALLAKETGIPNVLPSVSIREAITALTSNNKLAGRLLICGSLYLAGNMLKQNNGKIQ